MTCPPQTFELLLNAALAETVGRRLIPLLLVSEAFGDLVGELAGQSLGSAAFASDFIRSGSEMLLSMLASGGGAAGL